MKRSAERGLRGGSAHDEVGLLELLVLEADRCRRLRRSVREAVRRRLEAPEVPGRERRDGVVVEVACDRDDDVARDVGPAEEAHEIVAGEAADGLRGAEDGAAERVVGPESGGEELVDQLLGRVFDALDLLEDDHPLALELFLVEARGEHDVGEQVEGPGEVLAEHGRVEPGVLVRR